MSEKKVLIVSHIGLFPVDAGNKKRIIDTVNYLKENKYDVYFMNFGVSNYDVKRKSTRFFGNNHYFCYEKYDYRFSDRREKREKTNECVYYDVDELIPNGFGRYFVEILYKFKFDVVIAEYVISSYVLKFCGPSTLKIIDTHDIMTGREKLFIKGGHKPQGIYFQRDEEIRGLKRADVVWAIQREEGQILKEWLSPKVKVVTVGNPPEIVELPLKKSGRITFIGSGNTLNLDAANWLIKNVIPFVKKLRPDAVFSFAGTICSRLDDNSLYEKKGFVQNISSIYADTQIIVNPIKQGTGLNIKTIEALGYGRPIVSTSVGVKGLKNIESYVFICDSPQEMINSIIKLLDDYSLCEDYSRKAYKYIRAYNNLCKKKIEETVSLKKNFNKLESTSDIFFSVITVCRNAADVISDTVISVVEQSYSNYEYLIIDGASTDGTIDIIREFAYKYKKIRYISEKDNGIYDAMNKGAKLARNSYVIFLNAGDVFSMKDILKIENEYIKKNRTDIVVGNWKKIYQDKIQYVQYSKNSLWKMFILAIKYYHMANHQSIFAKRRLILENPFNESYRISADYDWYLHMIRKALFKQISIGKINECIVDYNMEGVSAQKNNYREMISDCNNAVKKWFPLAEKLHCDDWKMEEVLAEMHIKEFRRE